eukprot:c11375_g2_i7.p1 GENE.c11375_g2_i7~~c11375_g2_i7.p1  ORF type:complete len:120 (+),score=30.47 c11375_g2_i7:64-423(+)
MALKAESFLLQALKSSSPLARKGPGKVHESIILNPNRRKNPEEPLHLEVTDTTIRVEYDTATKQYQQFAELFSQAQQGQRQAPDHLVKTCLFGFLVLWDVGGFGNVQIQVYVPVEAQNN